MPRLLAVVLVLFCTSVTAEARSEQLGLVEFLNALQSFSATFVQQRYSEQGELLERASGDCLIKRPGLFRWEYREPFAQTIVSDGTTLSIYDPDLEQVTESDITGIPHTSPAALLGHETDVAGHYTITELASDERGLAWFQLRPLDSSGDFSMIELGFADGSVQAMRLRDNLGQLTALNFASVANDVFIDDAKFAFVPPPGVDVVRASAP